MNNKGFAITTLIYGLAIMMLLLIAIIMAVLSSMRRNMKDLSDQIENELLVLSNGTVEYTGYSNNYKNIYTVPQGGEGYYRIEVWSPRAMDKTGTIKNGYYATGIIKLLDNQQLFIYRGPYQYKRASYISVLKSNDYYTYSDESASIANVSDNDRILYVDSESGMMIGNADKYSRLFTLNSGFPDNHNFEHFYTYNNTRDFFKDPLIIPNVGTDENYGKVIIRKISSSNSKNPYDNSYNVNSWAEGEELQVRITDEKPGENDDYAEDCRAYYSYSYQTSCTMIGETPSPENESCTTSKYNSRRESYSLVDPYKHTTGTTYDYSTIRIVCPSEKKYDDLIFKVMISNGYIKEGTVDSLTRTTTVYEGKYRDNNGTGIQLSEYQLDSIVDKPEHGNFYILSADNNRYSMTSSYDGISVGMELLGQKETQRWSIDKVCNYDLVNHRCVNTKPNGTTIDKVYRIVDLSTYNALDIKYDENIDGNEITAQYNFNVLSINEPQLWRLIPNRDGTYSIKTVVEPFNNNNEEVGYITFDSTINNNDVSENNTYSLKIGQTKDKKIQDNQKFKLFSYDYSLSN